jgi:molybdate transport system substrate-binding protein
VTLLAGSAERVVSGSCGRRRDHEITVLAGMGVVSGVRDVVPAFERATGHKVIVNFEAGPSLMQKVNADAPADLVTHYPNVTDDLIKQGKVVGRRVDFARAGVGVVVKAGAPKPDIGSTEAFKHAMLAAKSIAYSTGASGIIVAKLMEQLGIAEQLKDKIKLVAAFRWPRLWQRGRPRSACSRSTSSCPLPALTTSVRCRRSYRASSISPSAC